MGLLYYLSGVKKKAYLLKLLYVKNRKPRLILTNIFEENTNALIPHIQYTIVKNCMLYNVLNIRIHQPPILPFPSYPSEHTPSHT